jgi:hypothetical protein
MIAIVLAGEEEQQVEAEPPAPTPAAPNEPNAPNAPSAPSVAQKPATPRVERAPAPARREQEPRDAPVSFRGGVWAHGGFASGMAPFPAFAASGGAELALDFTWLAPSVRAGAAYATGDTSVDARGGAEFRLLAFAGRVCPHVFSLAPRWSLAACASLELGELTARGVSTPNRLVQRMPWASLGVAPRVELALGRFAAFEAELGLRGIVRHDRFVFEPDAAEVYDVPRVAPHVSVGVSARLP